MNILLVTSTLYLAVLMVSSIVVIFSPKLSLIELGRSKRSMITVIVVQLLLIASLAGVAFSINPVESNDLYRHYLIIDKMRSGDLIWNAPDVLGSASSPLILNTLMFRLVALLPTNHFLQVISVLVVYGSVTIILTHHIYNYKMRLGTLAKFLLLHFSLMLTVNVFSGIRNAMAFALCSLAIYLDIFTGIKRTIGGRMALTGLYLLPSLLHPAAMLVPAVRIAMFAVDVIKRNKQSLFKFRNIIIAAVAVAGATYLMWWLGVFMKLRAYLFGEGSGLTADLRLFAARLVFLAGLVFVIHRLYKSNLNSAKLNPNYQVMLIVLTACLVASLIHVVFFDRLFILVSILILPLLVYLDSYEKYWNATLTNIVLVFYCLGMIAFNYVNVTQNMTVGYNHQQTVVMTGKATC